MSTEQATARKDALRAELEAARSELVAMIGRLSDDEFRRPSSNPAWTNGEALFHVVLGFMLLPGLTRVIRLFSRFPPGVSRGFAAFLDAMTPLFERVNALGPRLGARLYRGQAMARQVDRVHARILRILDSLDERDLDRGMHYPIKWDATYGRYMTIEQLYRLPAVHLRSHMPVTAQP